MDAAGRIQVQAASDASSRLASLSVMGRGDGKAQRWLYTFCMPSAKKGAIVTARYKSVTDVAVAIAVFLMSSGFPSQLPDEYAIA